MTPERQRIKIAEACGWKFTQGEDGECHTWYPNGEHCCSDFHACPTTCLPDYLNDLNAMHEAEKVLLTGACDDVRSLYLDYVFLQSEGFPDRFETHMTALTATAAQKAEAILKALNLWEERYDTTRNLPRPSGGQDGAV